MAKVTYTPIASYTLASAQSTITFNNVSGYKDLHLVISGGVTNDGYLFGIRVNGATSNYSYTVAQGDGSSASSGRKTGMVFGAGTNVNRNTLNNALSIYFPDYSNSSKYKSWLSKSANAQDRASMVISTYRSTDPITSITIAECGDGGTGTWSTGNILSGTTATLYGIL